MGNTDQLEFHDSEPSLVQIESRGISHSKLAEQECIIRFDEKLQEDEVYTSSKRIAGKLIKRGIIPSKTTNSGKETTSWFFTMPSYAVILNPDKASIRLGVSRGAETGKDAISER